MQPESGARVRGVYWKGKSYLVARNIPEGTELGVLLREVGAWHYYAAKVKLQGDEYYARLVVRESVNAEIYYDNDLTEVEKVGGRDVDATQPKAGAAPVSANKLSLRDWWRSVNEAPVGASGGPVKGPQAPLFSRWVDDQVRGLRAAKEALLNKSDVAAAVTHPTLGPITIG